MEIPRAFKVNVETESEPYIEGRSVGNSVQIYTFAVDSLNGLAMRKSNWPTRKQARYRLSAMTTFIGNSGDKIVKNAHNLCFA